MRLFNNIENSWNDLGGNNVIDLFERRWYQWNITDTIEWFRFTLDDKNMYEEYSSDSSSEHVDDDDDNDEKQLQVSKMIEPIAIDFKHVESILLSRDFSAKKFFPILVKSFQFEPFGFKNKNDQKLLCKKVKQLVTKYPKNKKKINKRNSKANKRDENNVNQFELEGYVQATN